MELTRIELPSAENNELPSRQAETLRERLTSALKIVDQMAGTPALASPNQAVSERDIRAILKLRRNRDLVFGGDLFADPSWDILLELYAAALGQLRISVTSVCVGAAVPATTALRWIGHLEERGLINRRADPTDGRRQFLQLSDEGLEAMNAYFRTVPANQRVL